jgi:hypothetical protein
MAQFSSNLHQSKKQTWKIRFITQKNLTLYEKTKNVYENAGYFFELIGIVLIVVMWQGLGRFIFLEDFFEIR